MNRPNLHLLDSKDFEKYIVMQQDTINNLMVELYRYAPLSPAFSVLSDQAVKQLSSVAIRKKGFIYNWIRGIAWRLLQLSK
jgi:hypothetical protein